MLQDQRTAAHIAAAEGHLQALTLLLDGPQPTSLDTATTPETAPTAASAGLWPREAVRSARDRWGRTPQDEARANGHTQCMAALQDS